MILLNPTDTVIQARFASIPPEVVPGEERLVPPQTFRLPPKDLIEVPDQAGLHFLDTFGACGVRQFRLGDSLADELLAGRHHWYRFLSKMILDHQQENERRAGQGLPPKIADDGLWKTRKTMDALEAEFRAQGEELTMKPIADFAHDPLTRETAAEKERREINARRGTEAETDLILAEKRAQREQQAPAS